MDLIRKGNKTNQYFSPKTKSKGNSSSLEFKNSVFTDNDKSRAGVITLSILGVFLTSTIGFLVIRRNKKRNGMKLINPTSSYTTYDTI